MRYVALIGVLAVSTLAAEEPGRHSLPIYGNSPPPKQAEPDRANQQRAESARRAEESRQQTQASAAKAKQETDQKIQAARDQQQAQLNESLQKAKEKSAADQQRIRDSMDRATAGGRFSQTPEQQKKWDAGGSFNAPSSPGMPRDSKLEQYFGDTSGTPTYPNSGAITPSPGSATSFDAGRQGADSLPLSPGVADERPYLLRVHDALKNLPADVREGLGEAGDAVVEFGTRVVIHSEEQWDAAKGIVVDRLKSTATELVKEFSDQAFKNARSMHWSGKSYNQANKVEQGQADVETQIKRDLEDHSIMTKDSAERRVDTLFDREVNSAIEGLLRPN